jgi:hypothetical protein
MSTGMKTFPLLKAPLKGSNILRNGSSFGNRGWVGKIFRW